MAATNSALSMLHSSPRRLSSCSLAPHLSFVSFRKTKLGFESKTSSKKLVWNGWSRGRAEKLESKKRIQWGVRCTAEGIDGGMLMGGRAREEGVAVVSIPERFKVVCLVACVMCLCNADRVVMSVAVVPLAAKYGWSTSFLGIVQVHP